MPSQKCECSPGFGGPWCQISEGAGALTAGHPFPTGPLTRVRVTQGPFSEMVREAELWRRKVRIVPEQGKLRIEISSNVSF